MKFLKKLFGKSEDSPKQIDDIPVDVEKAYHNTISMLGKYKKTAYLPVTAEQNNTFSSKSKIGGFPYLRNDVDWPQCPNCSKHMQLFLQLNLEDIPEKQEQGLVQLFYCTTSEPLCESDLEAFFPFSKAVECRKIDVNGASALIVPVIEEVFKEKIITDWTPMDDYPHPEEYEQLGIKFDFNDDVYSLMEERQVGLPLENDKLFGWPYWIQSVEYPFDRKTEQQMNLLFQFDSNENLAYSFGDSGIGHLTQSPSNSKELGFGWACT